MRQGNCTDPYAGIKIQWPQIKTVCSNGALNDSLMKTEYKDFAPRIGISYSPAPKWVVRMGAGVFFNQDIGNALFDMARNIAGRIRVVNANAGTPNIFWNTALAAISGGAKAQITSPFAFVDAYSHRTSYTMEYLMNVQRQLSNNWVVEAGYLGSLSRHLYGFLDANQPIPGTTSLASRTPFAQRDASGNPSRSNSASIQLVSDGANGNYNAGSLKVTKRFSAGLSVISSYTYAKSMDDTSGIRVQGFDTLYPQNSGCLSCERGLSAFNVKHRFVTSVLYDLPVGKGKALNVTNPFAECRGGRLAAWRSLDGPNRPAPGDHHRRRRSLRHRCRIRSSDCDRQQRLPEQSDTFPLVRPRRFCRGARGIFWKCRTEYAGRARHFRVRLRRAQGIPHALQGRTPAQVPPGGVQRAEPSVVVQSQRKYPVRCGIPRPAIDERPPGLRRDHRDGSPDAAGAVGIEVHVLTRRVVGKLCPVEEMRPVKPAVVLDRA